MDNEYTEAIETTDSTDISDESYEEESSAPLAVMAGMAAGVAITAAVAKFHPIKKGVNWLNRRLSPEDYPVEEVVEEAPAATAKPETTTKK